MIKTRKYRNTPPSFFAFLQRLLGIMLLVSVGKKSNAKISVRGSTSYRQTLVSLNLFILLLLSILSLNIHASFLDSNNATYSATTPRDEVTLNAGNPAGAAYDQTFPMVWYFDVTIDSITNGDEKVLFESGGSGIGVTIYQEGQDLKISLGNNQDASDLTASAVFTAGNRYSIMVELPSAGNIVHYVSQNTNGILPDTIDQVASGAWTDSITDIAGGDATGFGQVNNNAQAQSVNNYDSFATADYHQAYYWSNRTQASVFIENFFTLATNTINLTENASNTIRHQVNVNNIIGFSNTATFTITTSGANIFTSNPTPLVSFAADNIITSQVLNSTPTAATLYFTIIPDATGTGNINIILTDSAGNVSSQTITVIISPSSNTPIITQAFDSRLRNVRVLGGRVYANSVVGGDISGHTDGDNASHVEDFIDVLSLTTDALFSFASSQQEHDYIQIGLTVSAWQGLFADKVFSGANDNADYPFNLLADNNTISGSETYARVTGDGVFTLYPGYYEREWIQAGGLEDQPGNRFSQTGRRLRLLNRFLFDVEGFGTRQAAYKFPSGFTELTQANFTLNQESSLTQVATLSGFDLDGDNLVWSATDTFGNAASVSLAVIGTGATSTVNVFYQLNSNFANQRQTTLTISLSDGSATQTLGIDIFNDSPLFTLATTTINLNENASNTLRHQVSVNNITDIDGDSATFTITTSGANIFTTNPSSVISFATNSIITSQLLSSTPSTATLYFTIIPDATGTGNIDIALTDSTGNVSSQTISVIVSAVNVSPVITSEFDSRLSNINVYGGSLYGLTGQDSYDNLVSSFNSDGGFLVRLDTKNEEDNIFSAITANGFWSGVDDITNDSTWTYVNNGEILGIDPTPAAGNGGGFDVYPGFYENFSGSTNGREPNNFATNQDCLEIVNASMWADTNCDTTTVQAVFEFPNGLSELAQASFTLNQEGSLTQVATLSGFDLDGDNLTWSATDTFGNAASVSLAVIGTGATSTVNVFYQLNSNFANQRQTTLTISLSDGSATQTLGIDIFNDLPLFTLATTTINLNENASNTLRHQVSVNNITDIDGDSATFTITTSGANIFTTNPSSVISFATNSIITSQLLSSTPSTATLYFTIIPDATGTGNIDIALTDSTGNVSSQTITVNVSATNTAPIISQDITTFVNNAIANTVTNTYAYVNDVAIFGGKLYFSINGSNGVNMSDLILLQSAFSSSGQTVNNRLGAHIAIIDSEQEQVFFNTLSGGIFDAFLGMASEDVSGFGNSGDDKIWFSVLNDFIFESLNTSGNNAFAPGRYSFSINDDSDDQDCLRYQDNGDFNDRNCEDVGGAVDDGFFELPSGLPALTQASFTLNQRVPNTQVATLTGFDLDGDNLTWSGVDSNGNGTITFSNASPEAPTSTVGVFYQLDPQFIGNTTLTISLGDGSAIDTLDIVIFVISAPIFNLATNTINLVENTTNTMRYQLILSDVIDAGNNIATFTLNTSGATNILTTNPNTVISFASNTLITGQSLTSTPATAVLYFSIVPDATGMVAIEITLTNSFGSTFTRVVTITVSPEDNVAPVITSEFDNNLNNIYTFGGHLYAISGVSAGSITLHDPVLTLGSGAYYTVFDSQQELDIAVNNTPGVADRQMWLGTRSNSVVTTKGGSYQLDNTSQTPNIIYAQIDGASDVATVYAGLYEANFGLDNSQPFGTVGDTAYLNVNLGSSTPEFFTVFGNNSGADNRRAFFEFPTGLFKLSLASATINLGSVSTQVATLSGFDLNNDNMIWSGSNTFGDGGTITLSQTNISSSTSTIGVFYQPNLNFVGDTTLTISLGDGRATDTVAIVVSVVGTNFSLATNTINLVENASNTIAYELMVTNITIASSSNTFALVYSSNTLTSDPSPVVSFATSSIISVGTKGANTNTAILYFTLKPDVIGTDSITITLTDPDGRSSTRTVSIIVTSAVNLPIITNDIRIQLPNTGTRTIFGGKLHALSTDSPNFNTAVTNAFNRPGDSQLTIANSVEEFIFQRDRLNGVTAHAGISGQESDDALWYVVNSTSTNSVFLGSFPDSNTVNHDIAPGRYVNWESGVPNDSGDCGFWDDGDGSLAYADGSCSTARTYAIQFSGFPGSDTIDSSSIIVYEDTLLITQVATLTGLDFDGDALTWSGSDINSGTVTITTTATRTGINNANIFYQPVPNFYGNTTLTIGLYDGNATKTSSILVTVTPIPQIIDAVFDYANNVLTVAGTNLIANDGISLTLLFLTGETDNATSILTNSTATINSITQFTITVLGNDIVLVRNLLNRAGTQSNNGTDYYLDTADFWNGPTATPAEASKVITVINVPTATIATSTYNAQNSVLTIQGANFINLSGADINSNNIRLLGDNSASFTLLSNSVEIISSTQFVITLDNATDQANIIALIDSNGNQAGDGTTYVVSTLANWNGIDSVSSAGTDGTSTTLSVSNIPTATIDGVTYDYITNILTFTGSNLIVLSATNDIDSTQLSITGQGSGNQVLDTYVISVNNNASFTIALNPTDVLLIRALLRDNGTQSLDNTTYQLTASPTWNGVASVLDMTVISVSNVSVPSFTLASNVVNLTENASNSIYFELAITNIIDNDGDDNTFSVIYGNTVLTNNPTPIVSLATNTIDTTQTLSAVAQTATLYFTIKPDSFGTDSITITLTDQTGNASTATVVVIVAQTVNNPIIINNGLDTQLPNTTKRIVFGGKVYAVSTNSAVFNTAVTNAFNLSGDSQLAAPNSIEEYTFQLSNANNNSTREFLGLSGQESDDDLWYIVDGTSTNTKYLGSFPSNNTSAHDLAPGRYINWSGNEPNGGNGSDCGVWQNSGLTDTSCSVARIYHIQTTNLTGSDTITSSVLVLEDTNTTTQVATLTGLDFDGDSLTWSGSDTSGGTVTITTISTATGINNANISYQPALDFFGNTTLTISLYDGNATKTSSILVFVTPIPKITQATFTYSDNSFSVVGQSLIALPAATIDITQFIITGEGGVNSALTTASTAVITSSTQLIITVAGVDIATIRNRLNRLGLNSDDNTSYVLTANQDWNGSTAEISAIGINVIGLGVVNLLNATYNFDFNQGTLTISSTNLIKTTGDDIKTNNIIIRGENNATHTLNAYSVEIDSSTQFTIVLDSTDTTTVNAILNRNGNLSILDFAYNLNASAAYNGQDSSTSNVSITVEDILAPIISTATFNYTTGLLNVEGVNLVNISGSGDIDLSQLTILGEGGSNFTLSGTINIDSSTQFRVSLTGSDFVSVRDLLNKNGTQSLDNTAYQLTASPTWNDSISALNTSNIVVSGVTEPTFTLSITSLNLFEDNANTLRQQVVITNIIDIDNNTASFTITTSGDNIFTTNPSPVVSFSSTTITTEQTLSSTASTATLYLTIIPDTLGTGVLNISLTDILGNASSQSITITVNALTNDPVITQAFDSRLNNIFVFGRHIYASANFAGAGSASSATVYDAINTELGGHFTIINTVEENTAVGNTGWQGLVSSQNVANDGTSYPFDLVIEGLNGSTQTHSVVASDGVDRTYPGFYDYDWSLSGGTENQPSDELADGTLLRRVNGFLFRENNASGANRSSSHEFPNGFTALNQASFTLTRQSGLTQVATLSGFDLDGASLTWSATDTFGNAASVSLVINGIGATSTANVFYQPSTNFTDSTVTISLSDGTATDTLGISIFSLLDFTLATTTINLTENASNTLRHQVGVSNIFHIENDRSTFTITTSGATIFTTNPTPVVSFSSITITTTQTLSTTPSTATLYFTIIPDATGTGNINIILTDSAGNVSSQTISVIVIATNTSPVIINVFDSRLSNINVYGGSLYGLTGQDSYDNLVSSFNSDGGFLVRLDTKNEEDNIFSAITANGFWSGVDDITNDSTWTYVNNGEILGIDPTPAAGNGGGFDVYPGFYENFSGSINGREPNNFATNQDCLEIINASMWADTNCDTTTVQAVFEFPNGFSELAQASATVNQAHPLTQVTTLAGFDLDGDNLTWSATDTFGNAASVSLVVNGTGATSTVNVSYQPLGDFTGNTTLTISLSDGSATDTLDIVITVVPIPKINSASFNYANNVFTVDSTFLIQSASINLNLFNLTGEIDNATTVLTNSTATVNSTTQFTITVLGNDIALVRDLLNAAGTASDAGVIYNLGVSQGWHSTGLNDPTNTITVTNIPTATIATSTYDARSRVLIIQGANFINLSSADINSNNIRLLGDNRASFTLLSNSVEIQSSTQFIITLDNATDQTNIIALIDSNGNQAGDGTAYVVSTLANWNGQDSVASTDTDGTSAILTVSNIPTATIDNVNFDFGISQFTITGSNLIALANTDDINSTQLSITGQNASTTVLSAYSIEVLNNASFTIDLDATDSIAVRVLLNNNGTRAQDNTTYVLTASPTWNGVASVLDTSSINVTNVSAPVFTPSSTTINLVENASNTIYYQLTIIGVIDDDGNDIGTFSLTHSTNTLTNNPTPIISFATDTVTTSQALGTVATTATLYFTIKPDTTGIDEIVITLTDETGNSTSATVTIIVGASDNLPIIINNLATQLPNTSSQTIFGGKLYAISTDSVDFNTAVTNAFNKPGDSQLTIVNSVEEFNFQQARVTLASQIGLSGQESDNDLWYLVDGTSINTKYLGSFPNPTTSNHDLAPGRYTNWTSGEPSASNSQDCGHWNNDNSLFEFGNRSCSTTAIYHIQFTSFPGSDTITSSALVLEDANTTTQVATLTGLDFDGDLLTWSGNNNSDGGTVTITTTSTATGINNANIFYQPVLDFFGNTTLTISLYDGNATKTSSILVFVTPIPKITQATFTYSNNSFNVFGQNFITLPSATIDITQFSLFGEAGFSTRLTSDSTAVINTSAQLIITIAGADTRNVRDLLNRAGSNSDDGNRYVLIASLTWNGSTAPLSTLTINVVSVPTATISNASYTFDSSGLASSFIVLGNNFIKTTGDDIKTNRFTIRGEGNVTHTIGAYSVEIQSSTQFSLTLNASDSINVNVLLNLDGQVSVSGNDFNIRVDTAWNGQDSLVDNASITVQGSAFPIISTTTFNYASNTLTVYGENFNVNTSIEVTNFIITGESSVSISSSYTLTSDSTVTNLIATSFDINLTGNDSIAIRDLLNRAGTASNNGTEYLLDANANWNGSSAIADVSNTIVVTNIPTATINAATYGATNQVLTVIGNNFINLSSIDIDSSKLQLLGDDNASFTLLSASVEIQSSTQFIITLDNVTDQANIRTIIDSNGTRAGDGTTYVISTLAQWNSLDSVASPGSGTATLEVSNIPNAVIDSVNFNYINNVFTFTGSNLIELTSLDDIDSTQFSITGQSSNTQVLSAYTIEVINNASFTITLNANDSALIRALLNQNGTQSQDNTPYLLTASPSFNGVVSILDTASITVSDITVPSFTLATTITLIENASNTIYHRVEITNIIDTDGDNNTFSITHGTNVLTTDPVVIVSFASNTVATTQTLSANPATAVLYFTTKPDTVGTDTIVITLTDQSGNSSSVSVTIIVNESMNNPIITGDIATQLPNTESSLTIFGGKLFARSTSGATFTNALTTANNSPGNSQILVINSLEEFNFHESRVSSDGSDYLGLFKNDQTNELWYLVDGTNTNTQLLGSFPTGGASGHILVPGRYVNWLDATNQPNNDDRECAIWRDDGDEEYAFDDQSCTSSRFYSIQFTSFPGSDTITSSVLVLEDANTTTQVATLTGLDFDGDSLTWSGSDTSGGTVTITTISTATGINNANISYQPALNFFGNTTLTISLYDGNATKTSSILMSVTPIPRITQATFTYSDNSFSVVGQNLLALPTTTIDITQFIITGEGGINSALTTASTAVINSSTQLIITVAGVDIAPIRNRLNRLGLNSNDNTSYVLTANQDWNGSTAEISAIGVNVIGLATATIATSTYNANNQVLTIQGANFINLSSADINSNNIRLLGDNSTSFTLLSNSVEIQSSTQFIITLDNSTDQTNIIAIIDSNGTRAGDGTAYVVSTLANWNGQDSVASTDTDGTSTTLTVSNIPTATIDNVNFDYGNNLLTFTGSNLIVLTSLDDINSTQLTITGESSVTPTTLSAYSINVNNNASFTINLNSTDAIVIRDLLNRAGSNSDDSTSYLLTASPSFNGVASVFGTSTIFVQNIPTASILSATYTFDNNNNNSTLTISGNNLINTTGDDINLNAFIITGEGNATTSLIAQSIEIESATQFVVLLNPTNTRAVNNLLNNNGPTAITGATFNIAALASFNGQDAPIDSTNSIFVQGINAPTITLVSFDYSANRLVLNGLNFRTDGITIVSPTLLSLLGEGSTTLNSTNTFTLTNSSDIVINSATTITISFNANDLANIRNLLNRAGANSNNGTTYTLIADNFWHSSQSPNNGVGIGLTVSNIPTASINNASYNFNANSATLTVDATNLIKLAGNDIDTTQINILGDNGASYTLQAAYSVEITSSTQFSFALDQTDTRAVNLLLDSNGNLAGDGTTYTLTVLNDYNGFDSISSSSSITTSNVPTANH